jgi:DNA-binding beta-propeller fold protein YncE
VVTAEGAGHVLAVAQPGMAAANGALERLPGRSGCVNARGDLGCARTRGLKEPRAVAVSRDGGSVYVASPRGNAVAVFRRSPLTGGLRQLRGRAGCLRQRGGRGCARARALRGPAAIGVSLDGRNVYVTSTGSDAIAVFARSRRTGVLRQLRARAGCVGDRPGGGCRDGRALADVTSLAFSPDGRFLYVGSERGGIAVFRRNPRTGGIVQLAGADGCVTAQGREGCALGRSIAQVTDLEVDRGGDNVYAASFRDGAVAVFARLPGGVLRQPEGAAGCISGDFASACAQHRMLADVSALAGSPRGSQLYATATFRAAVATLARDPATGSLSDPPGRIGCIRDTVPLSGCGVARFMLGPEEIAVSQDGRNAYVTTFESAPLVVLRRNRTTGELSDLPGRAGCIGPHPRFEGACTSSRGLQGASAIALSRDGRSAYVTWAGEGRDALAVYRRAR